MGNRRTIQAYNPDEIERLKSVALPEKIKCGRCGKNFGQTKYSTKQLTDLRYHVKTTGRITKPINCQNCTGQPIVEIECMMCHKTKGLEEFAKSQRKNPDNARCYKCTDDQVNTQPVDDEKYEHPEKAFVTPDHSNGHIPEYWSSATSFMGSTADDSEWASTRSHNTGRSDSSGGGVALSNHFRRALSINGSATDILIESEYEYGTVGGSKNSDGDAWSEVRSKSWHTRSTGTPSASSGFNPHKYGQASATSNTGTARTYSSSVAERSDASDIRRNEWAKIKAYRPPTPPSRHAVCKPMGDVKHEVEEATDLWGGSDGSDEEEDDDDDDDDSDGENTEI